MAAICIFDTETSTTHGQVAQRAMSHESQVLEDVVRQRNAPAAAMQNALDELGRAQSASRAQIAAIGSATTKNAAAAFRIEMRFVSAPFKALVPM